MIALNNFRINVGFFPDGTQNIKFQDDCLNVEGDNTIIWLYETDAEMFTLASVVDFVKRNVNKRYCMYLYCPFLPNSRMDRIKSPKENFALKVFADFINSFCFDKVYVHNVHSNVSEALIDNIEVARDIDEDIIKSAIKDSNADVVFFPDEGACKRYSDMDISMPTAFGIKKRDWQSGKILGLDVVTSVDLNGKNIIIIDDICSAGGTFKYSAMKLKEMGASDVKLFITHCEDNIQNGDLLNTDLISTIYTTDSILHIEDEKIKVIYSFKNSIKE